MLQWIVSHFWKQSEHKAVSRLKDLVEAGEVRQAVHNVLITFSTLKALKAFLTSVAEDSDVARRFVPVPHGQPQPKKKHWHYALDVVMDEEDETQFQVKPQIRIPPEDLIYLVKTLGGKWDDL